MALRIIEKDSSGVPTGNYPICAGKGKAEYGASTVRSGQVTMGAISAGGRSSKNVAFDSPMPDGNYLIVCTVSSSNKDCLTYNYHSQTASGFQLVVGNASSADETNVVVIYTAFKLYTDHEYNAVLDSGSCAHGTNEPFMAGQPIRTYLLGLDGHTKFATFTVDPTASTVTDKINTTEYFSYNCYRQGGSWRVVAINSNGNKMYIADVSSSTPSVTWTKLVTEDDVKITYVDISVEASENTKTVTYPSGFNMNNTVIISVMGTLAGEKALYPYNSDLRNVGLHSDGIYLWNTEGKAMSCRVFITKYNQ